MNKQELIEKLDEEIQEAKLQEQAGGNFLQKENNTGRTCALQYALNLVRRLDEPTHDKCYEKMADYEKQIGNLERQIEEMGDREPGKVKVKQFVANWYEEHKRDLNNSLWELTVKLNEKTKKTGNSYTVFEGWFIDWPWAYDTIVRMQYGYEIEKEPQWVVRNNKVSNEHFDLYFKSAVGIDNEGNLGSSWSALDGCLKFPEKEKAEAVALLVDGSVEEE